MLISSGFIKEPKIKQGIVIAELIMKVLFLFPEKGFHPNETGIFKIGQHPGKLSIVRNLQLLKEFLSRQTDSLFT